MMILENGSCGDVTRPFLSVLFPLSLFNFKTYIHLLILYDVCARVCAHAHVCHLCVMAHVFM